MSGMNDRGPSKYSMSVSMYRGGARGSGRPRTAPPDLPSLLLDARIVYLGMPVLTFSWILPPFNWLHAFYICTVLILILILILILVSFDCHRLYQLLQSFLLLSLCGWIMTIHQSLYTYI